MRSLVDDLTHSVWSKNVWIWNDFYGTHYTKDLLANTGGCCMRDMKKVIKGVDSKRCLEQCLIKVPPISEVTKQGGSWSKLWDVSLYTWAHFSPASYFKDVDSPWSRVNALFSVR